MYILSTVSTNCNFFVLTGDSSQAPRHAEPIKFRLPDPETDSAERNRKAAKRVTREESRFQSGEFIKLLE